MLSQRGAKSASVLDIPWRFVSPGPLGRYDPDSNPSGVVTQFTSAENGLVQQELADFVREKVEIPPVAFGYKFSTAGGPRLPAALAAHLNEYWKPYKPLVAGDIIITGAATALHEILGMSLLDSGQGILTSRPYYGRFELDFGIKAGVQIVRADNATSECLQPSVVQSLEDALQKSNAGGVQIKALLIINPHNPLGRCYSKETLVALMQFCQKHQIHLISDEIYGLSVFESGESDTQPFTSVLSIEPWIDENLLHVIYGMSKDYGIPGLRVGALITRSKPLLKACSSMIRFANPSGASVAIASAMLEDREWCRDFINLSRTRVAEAYKFITQELERIGVKYLRGTNAGLFVWVDFSPYLSHEGDLSQTEREQAFAQKALNNGLFLQPCEEHGLELGWFRLVYTVERRVVEEGLRRLESVIRS